MGRSKSDHLRVRGLKQQAILRDNPWSSPGAPHSLQPTVISIDIVADTSKAGRTDQYTESVDYTAVSKNVQELFRGLQFKTEAIPPSAEEIAEHIASLALGENPLVQEAKVEVELPKGLIGTKGLSITVTRKSNGNNDTAVDLLQIKDLSSRILIGAREKERAEKQVVVVNVTVNRPYGAKDSAKFDQAAKFLNAINDFTEETTFQSIEAFADASTRVCLEFWGNELVVVDFTVGKPLAVPLADVTEVTITRSMLDYPARGPTANETSDAAVYAAIGIGSNLGNRYQNIEMALQSLELQKEEGLPDFVTLIATSFLYETPPMYVTDQPKFLNCACLVQTSLNPFELLDHLHNIENSLDRVRTMENGPRTVDLDILTYGCHVVDTRADADKGTLDNYKGYLAIPHPRMAEREFVLRPLNDIMPDFCHPVYSTSIKELLADLENRELDSSIVKVVPFPFQPLSELDTGPNPGAVWTFPASATSWNRGGKYIMAILNATPDSFSDGGQHNEVHKAVEFAIDAVRKGAAMIDVGGYSTRPGARSVSVDEEIRRVVPIIEGIRSSNGVESQTLISVDTFSWEVARAAIQAGANCINDVYAFSGPDYPPSFSSESYFEEMMEVAKEFGVPVILMHSRGDAGSNKDYSAYEGGTSPAVIEAIRHELGEKVQRAIRGPKGLRRWQVIVDGGVGFSKTVQENLDVIRHASDVTLDTTTRCNYCRTRDRGDDLSLFASPRRNPLVGFPQLSGVSRKTFLGTIIAQPGNDDEGQGHGTDARDRVFATAAATSIALHKGISIFRVHDVLEMFDVVKVATALSADEGYNQPPKW